MGEDGQERVKEADCREGVERVRGGLGEAAIVALSRGFEDFRGLGEASVRELRVEEFVMSELETKIMLLFCKELLTSIPGERLGVKFGVGVVVVDVLERGTWGERLAGVEDEARPVVMVVV